MKATPEQLQAATDVLKPFVADDKVCLGALVLQVITVFNDAAPGKKAKARKDSEPDGFSAFYTAYPRRVGRRTAAQAYASALGRTSPEIILAACKAYSVAMRGTEPQYIKHPSTWLNGDHFKDELGQMTLAGGTEAFSETSSQGWLRRLETWAGKTESPRGTWLASWGPPPRTEGCMVPESAKKAYLELYPPKTKNSA